MKKRLGHTFVFALLGGCLSLSACGDDDDSGDPGDTAGRAGSSAGHAGNKTGGSSSAGSSNKAGTNSGGKAGNGTGGEAGSGTGGMPEGGAAGAGGASDAGAGGEADGGAAGSGGAAGGDGGAGGAGGAPEPTLTYACGSDTLPKKLCSAFVGAECTDPTVCADCVPERTSERNDFLALFASEACATCTDKFDAYFQCAVDAYESGDISSGVECLDDYGADFSFDCVALLDQANSCHTYLKENPCPSSWPPAP